MCVSNLRIFEHIIYAPIKLLFNFYIKRHGNALRQNARVSDISHPSIFEKFAFEADSELQNAHTNRILYKIAILTWIRRLSAVFSKIGIVRRVALLSISSFPSTRSLDRRGKGYNAKDLYHILRKRRCGSVSLRIDRS